MVVVKRDATCDEFQKSKIVNAIEKAMKSGNGNGLKPKIAEDIADEIYEENKDKEELSIFDIEKMVYDQQQGWPLCPRCGERMPDKLTHGALSRHAKGVYICEACGTDEALRDWTGNVKPLSDWVLVRVYNGDLRR